MRIDGFLKIEDIPGESVRDGHEDEIQVHGVEFSMEAPYDPIRDSRRGRVAVDTIRFTKYYDKSSPSLKRALFDNVHLDEVVFSARRTVEGETSDYLVVTLTDASVLAYALQPATDAPDLLEERIAFAFRAIGFSYDDSHEVELVVRGGR